MTRIELIPLLNGDLAREYAAALQYKQHASVIDGLYLAFAPELETHAGEELGHAKTLSDYINYFGGIPVGTPTPVYGASEPAGMLHLDLAAEQEAITRYKERVKQALECEEYGIANALMGILQDEEQHENDLKTMLGMK